MKANDGNEAVKTLLGNPKAALIKLSIPIILSMMAHVVFQLADIIWVSGLGPEAIAAVGFYSPLVFLSLAIASGITVGGGTCISQKLGAKDKSGAEKIVTHMFVLIILGSGLFIAPLLLFSRPLFLFLGAQQTIELTLSYSRIMIINFFFQFMLEGAATLLRSEGDSKSAMKIMLMGIGLNTILDPIFIFLLDLGVSGAAYASLISMLLVTLIWVYWFFIKQMTYVSIRISEFRLDAGTFGDILHLGFPVFLAQLFSTIMIFVNTKIVSHIGGPDGVAVYQGGLRFWNLTLLPLFGVASALTTVIGAAWGAQDRNKIKEAFRFALKVTLVTEGALMVLTFIAAPLITTIYTWSEEAGRLSGDFILFFRIIVTINLAAVIVFIAESLFVGIGQGTKKLFLTFLRSAFFVVPLTLLLGILLDYGLVGVWTGISAGNWLAAFVAIGMSLKLFKSINGTMRPAINTA